MSTSPYMPDVVIEVAFDSGYATPDVDRTWTDVSEWVELADEISIVFGRQNERGTADANTLDLVLDNSDGRFTAGLASSPYYPNVKIGRPIRVTATPVGGTPSVRFVGFVDSWPVSWDGTDETATADISATSRLARLGYDASLRSIVEETVLVDAPAAYFTLAEPEGATAAADSSGGASGPLVMRGTGTPVVFGSAIGPGTDDLTAAQFAGGQFLEGPIVGAAPSDVMVVECFMLASAATDMMVLEVRRNHATGPDFPVVYFTIQAGTGYLQAFAGNNSTGAAAIADGTTRHIALAWELASGDLRFYVDGVLAGSGAASAVAADFDLTRLSLGKRDDDGFTSNFTGVLSHVAIYLGADAEAGIPARAEAGLTGFADESAADRLVRYASFAGIPAAEVSSSATTEVAHVDTTGSNVVDMMRKVETAEGGAGVLFDDRDGVLTLSTRDSRNAPAGLTFDFARQEIGGNFVSTYSRDFVVNDATAANADGTVTARVFDAASRDDLGPVAVGLETIASDPSEPYRAAAWLVNTSAEPKPRSPALTVDLLPFVAAPSQNDVLDATVGTLLTVTNQPAQAPASTGYYFVEGYSETIGPESYSLAFNVSPGEPYINLVTFDDADRGFDSGAVFAY